MNPMREIKIEKVTINIGVGEGGERLEKAKQLLELITKRKAIITRARKRIPNFNIKKGNPIGVKVTLRGREAIDFLNRALDAIDYKVRISSLDEQGNLNFGIKQYIDLPGIKYIPEIGMFGMDVAVTLERRGYRIKRRRLKKSKIGKKHMINKKEAQRYFEENFHIKFI